MVYLLVLCLLLVGLAVVGLAVVGLAPFAGDTATGGSAIAAERIEPGAGGVPISTVPSATSGGDSGGEPGGPADPAVGNHVVAGVLADLESFWDEQFAAQGLTAAARPAGGYISLDSSAASGSALCIGEPAQITGNAYYCPQGDGIVFDSSALVPVLLGHYGVAGLATAFAHEFGHAVQARIGPTQQEHRDHPARYPAILIEAQADCDAGAFLAWVVAGHSSWVRIPRESLLRAITPVLDFRDAVTLTPSDPTAHGLGLDRLTVLLKGYREGAKACHDLTADSLQLTLGQPGVRSGPASTVPRYASTAQAVAAAGESVSAFARKAGHDLGRGADLPAAADLQSAGPYGQFAQASAVALAAGRSITGNDSGAACFAGAWAASVFGHAQPGALGSWPGDADEALDLVRSRPGATFEQVAGYADGFHAGIGGCG